MMLKRMSRNKFYNSLDECSTKKDKQHLLQFGSNRGFSSLDNSTMDDYTTLSCTSSIKLFKRSRLNELYTFIRYKHAVTIIRRFLKKVILSRRSRTETSKVKKSKSVRLRRTKVNHSKLWDYDDNKYLQNEEKDDGSFDENHRSRTETLKVKQPKSVRLRRTKFNHSKLWEDDDNALLQNEEKDDGSFDENDDITYPKLDLLLSSDSSYYLEAMQLEMNNDECGAIVCNSKMVKFKSRKNNQWLDELLPISSKSVTNQNTQFGDCYSPFRTLNKNYIEI